MTLTKVDGEKRNTQHRNSLRFIQIDCRCSLKFCRLTFGFSFFWCAAVPNALNIAMHKEPNAKNEVKRSAECSTFWLATAAKFGWNKKWNSWWQLEYRSFNSAKNCERGRAHSGLDKRQERSQTRRFRTEDAQIFLKKCILFFCTRFWWFFFRFSKRLTGYILFSFIIHFEFACSLCFPLFLVFFGRLFSFAL